MAQKEVYENFKALKMAVEAASNSVERLAKKMKKSVWEGVPEDAQALLDKAGAIKGLVDAIRDAKGI